MNKCKGCEWHNKPYWSIINPCENCPREETNIEIITRWVDPTIEEKDKEIERLNNIINKAIEIYENRNSIEYKKKRFMEDKTIGYYMYEELKGVDKE